MFSKSQAKDNSKFFPSFITYSKLLQTSPCLADAVLNETINVTYKRSRIDVYTKYRRTPKWIESKRKDLEKSCGKKCR